MSRLAQIYRQFVTALAITLGIIACASLEPREAAAGPPACVDPPGRQVCFPGKRPDLVPGLGKLPRSSVCGNTIREWGEECDIYPCGDGSPCGQPGTELECKCLSQPLTKPGTLFFIQPPVFSTDGTGLLQPSRLVAFDPATKLKTVLITINDVYAFPQGLTVDADGTLYFGNSSEAISGPNFALWKRSPDGGLTQITFLIGGVSEPTAVHECSPQLAVGSPGELVLSHPATYGTDPVIPGTVEVFDGAVVAAGIHPCSLSADRNGRIFFSDIRDLVGSTSPVYIEIAEATAGHIADVPAFSRIEFEISTDGLDHLFFISPLTGHSIETIDLSTNSGPQTIYTDSSLLSGLAADGSGNVYFGRILFDPLRVELMRWTPGGTDSLGIVVDTSGGVASFGAFDLTIQR